MYSITQIKFIFDISDIFHSLYLNDAAALHAGT